MDNQRANALILRSYGSQTSRERMDRKRIAWTQCNSRSAASPERIDRGRELRQSRAGPIAGHLMADPVEGAAVQQLRSPVHEKEPGGCQAVLVETNLCIVEVKQPGELPLAMYLGHEQMVLVNIATHNHERK
jgi:hypothetical protein